MDDLGNDKTEHNERNWSDLGGNINHSTPHGHNARASCKADRHVKRSRQKFDGYAARGWHRCLGCTNSCPWSNTSISYAAFWIGSSFSHVMRSSSLRSSLLPKMKTTPNLVRPSIIVYWYEEVLATHDEFRPQPSRSSSLHTTSSFIYQTGSSSIHSYVSSTPHQRRLYIQPTCNCSGIGLTTTSDAVRTAYIKLQRALRLNAPDSQEGEKEWEEEGTLNFEKEL